MQNIIYKLTKDILEETPFVSFKADDKAMTFTCNQFDQPIVLAIVNEFQEDDEITLFHQITSVCGGDEITSKVRENLQLALQVIRTNFLTETIHCKIYDDCLEVSKLFSPINPALYKGKEIVRRYCTLFDNGNFSASDNISSLEINSKKKFKRELFYEIDIFKFFEDNRNNRTIFVNYINFGN